MYVAGHGFHGAMVPVGVWAAVWLAIAKLPIIAGKTASPGAYLQKSGRRWRFFAHCFGPLAVVPARRGAHAAAARGLAPLSAFCPTNAIFYICQMLFKHPDRLSFLVPAALFRLGPVGLCQWLRSICLPMAPICFATWRQVGLRRVFACTTPCMVRLAVDVASVDENVCFF